MRSIAYVPPVALVDTKGQPWPSAQAQKTLTQLEFLQDNVGQDGFAGERRGAKQVQFQLAVLKALDDTAPGAPYQLEDEHYNAIAAAIEKADFMAAVAHNLAPFVAAVLAAS